MNPQKGRRAEVKAGWGQPSEEGAHGRGVSTPGPGHISLDSDLAPGSGSLTPGVWAEGVADIGLDGWSDRLREVQMQRWTYEVRGADRHER